MMDNEITNREELAAAAEETAEQIPQEQTDDSAPWEDNTRTEELAQLRAEVSELRLKLALLTGGAVPEKLCEGVKFAAGIMSADGTEPEEAAAETLREYPHLRLVKRSIPQFSAESRGTGDGFAAIRSIFAKK